MKRSCSFLTFLLSSTTIILSSCGGGLSSIKKSFSINALLGEERPISNEERIIATRICTSYQSKSMKFRSTEFLGTRFIFSGKNIDCQNNTTTYPISSTMNYDLNNNLAYIPASSFDPNLMFMKKVQTDASGYLAQICTKIKNNEVISNTTTQSGVKVQLSFIREGLDGFVLQYFNQRPDNTYKMELVEKFKVRTQVDFTNGQILGMDEYYSAQRVCGSQFDKRANSDFEQTFTSR